MSKDSYANNMKIFCSLLVAVALFQPYAISQAKELGEYQHKDFMSDYSKLEPEGGESKAFGYRDSTVEFKKYNKLMIDRIKVWVKDDAEYKGIDPAELKELVDYFHQAIVDAVSDKYPVVTEPGPDVLRLRLAITDLVPNKVSASVVSLVVPALWLGEAGAGAAEGEAGSTPFVGEATIELEAMDSQSNKQVAAYIETRIGKKYYWTKGVATGISQYSKAYSTWAYTKEAMDYWANLVRERLDAARTK